MILDFRRILLAVALAGSTVGAAANGPGLTVNPEATTWPRWQARLMLNTPPPLWRDGFRSLVSAAAGAPASLGVLGDYYLTGPVVGAGLSGGFRATSGIVVGSLAQAFAPSGRVGSGALTLERRVFGLTSTALPGEGAAETPTTPYLGLGYTGLSARGGWSFNADLGLASRSPGGGLKLGSVLSGSQSLDEKVRDMRWAPVVQLNINYAF